MLRRWKLIPLLLVVPFAYTVATAGAAEKSEREVTELDEIIVTATRGAKAAYDTPNAVTLITGEELRRRMPLGPIDALVDEAGVYAQRTTNGQGSPIVRGFTGYHTLLLIDGVRLNNSLFRSGPNQYFNTLDVDGLSRIEVVRGPSSVLYGSSSLGGIVQAFSREPEPVGDTLEVRPRIFGRWASAAGDGIGGIILEGGRRDVSFWASIGRRSAGDVQPGKGRDVHVKGKKFFLTSTDDDSQIPATFTSNGKTYERTRLYDTETPTAYTETDGNAVFVWQPAEGRTLRVAYQGVRQVVTSRWDKVSTGEDFSVLRFDPQERHLAYARYRTRELLPGVSDFAATLSFQRQKEGTTKLKVGKDPATDTKRVEDAVNTIGVSLVASSAFGDRQRITYGADAYADSVSSTQLRPKPLDWGTYPDGSTAMDVNVFVQDDVTLSDAAEATVGLSATTYRVRADLSLRDPAFGVLEKTGSALTGSAALAYELIDGLKLHAAVGRGFRAPTLNDLSAVQVTNQGIQAPSPDVRPERSLNLEVGMKVRARRFGGSLALFHTRLSDKMVARPVADVYGANLPQSIRAIQDEHPDTDVTVLDNLDESVVQGIEADVNVSPARGWTLYGVGTVTRGKVVRLKGNAPDPSKPWEARIRREPPLFGTVGLRWQPATSSTWAELFARGAAAQRRLSKGDIRDPRIPGFTRKVENVRFDENGAAIDAGTPGWFTLNARVGATVLDRVRATLAVENILDRRYRWHGSGVDAPGRNVLLSLDTQF